MKRKCKHIDITDPNTIYPWVYDCVRRHYKRHDFERLLYRIGKMSKEDYQTLRKTHDKTLLYGPVRRLSKEAARQIREEQLTLTPITYRNRADPSSFKMRIIGKEGAMQ